MLTQKTRYAILALTKLSQEYQKSSLTISQIAKSENLPKRFLESILLELKNNGYLGSRLGKNGGYYLIKKPSEISLLEIVRLFEGAIALLPCISEKYYTTCEHCKDEKTCKVRLPFYDIRTYTYNKLKETTFGHMI